MNHEDITRMAREAGATQVEAADPQCWIGAIAFETYELERFAALVAAAEREACAKVCDAADKSTHPADLADAIRARGRA